MSAPEFSDALIQAGIAATDYAVNDEVVRAILAAALAHLPREVYTRGDLVDMGTIDGRPVFRIREDTDG